MITYDTWLQVNEEGSGNMFSSSCLRKEGVEGINALTHSQVTGHLPIRLDSVLQTVQFPTGIAHLNPSLAHMDGNYLSHSHGLEFGFLLKTDSSRINFKKANDKRAIIMRTFYKELNEEPHNETRMTCQY